VKETAKGIGEQEALTARSLDAVPTERAASNAPVALALDVFWFFSMMHK